MSAIKLIMSVLPVLSIVSTVAGDAALTYVHRHGVWVQESASACGILSASSCLGLFYTGKPARRLCFSKNRLWQILRESLFTSCLWDGSDYKYVMDVSFSNNLFAGAYLLKEDKSSNFTTVYEADSNATYQTTFSYVSEQTPGNPRHWDFLGRDSYLVFRTRTCVDAHGNLVAAHYGKILGRWLSDTEFMILSDGCFNPVENDVNIEDGSCLRDVLRNLGRE